MTQRFLIIAVAVASLPLIVWLESNQPTLWRERLVWPNFVSEENRHTPANPTAEYLPPVISASRTLTAAESPLLIAGQVYVPLGVTLTLEPGTRILVHEYGSLVVDGSLQIRGTAANPVMFDTNEAHAANQVWSGITLATGSTSQLEGAVMRQASPAVTCEEGSRATIRGSTFELGNTGLVTASRLCSLRQSTIQHVNVGVVALAEPILQNVTIRASQQDIQRSRALPTTE